MPDIGGIYVTTGLWSWGPGHSERELRKTLGLIAVEGLGFTCHGEPKDLEQDGHDDVLF